MVGAGRFGSNDFELSLVPSVVTMRGLCSKAKAKREREREVIE